MYQPNKENFKGFYTGVGSRETPLYIYYMMAKLAIIFEKGGYILRSGCALGADAAFEDVLENPAENAEIYVPNKFFPKKMSTTMKSHYIIPKERYGEGMNGLYREAMRLIHNKNIHKGWKNCKPYVMDLHNRNMFQVLGLDLMTKSKFTICYTSNGEKKYDQTNINTGGTATAINASDLHGVEVYNLGCNEDYIRLNKFIKKYENVIDYEKLNNTIIRSDFAKRKTFNEVMDIIKNEEKIRESKINKKRKVSP